MTEVLKQTQAVVFLPGIMGSILKRDAEVIWPGSVTSVLLPYNRMADLMRPELVATDVWRKLGPFDVYDSLLTDLENWGFKPGETLFPFPYDWRKSNGTAAQQLADLVDNITAQHKGDVVITLLAHSMGGLVARYYLESAVFANRPGFSKVTNLFTMGTPHRGAPLALTAGLGMEKRVFLSASQVLQLVSDARFPAVYELLPPLGEPFLWNNAGKHDPQDVYSQKIATDPGGLNLNASNLHAAQTFRLGLDFVRKPASVRYFSFYGTDHPTSAYLTLNISAKDQVRSFALDKAGDGTVPIWSGQPNGIQSMPVPGEHSKLFRSDALRNMLIELLGAPTRLAAEITVELSLSPKVLEPANLVHASLVFPNAPSSIQGTISVFRLQLDEKGEQIGEAPLGSPININYDGGSAEAITITFDAPNLKGYYRVRFQATGMNSAEDEFVVQDPPDN
jgi:pimeloyl-ACP methyl ester carboxylesterase